jgi:DNA-binding NarL/FixJ family response regulator
MVPAVETLPSGRKPALSSVRAAEILADGRLFSRARWRQLSVALALAPRQSEIVQLICDGHGYKAIAQRTGISINTVRMHMRALFAKLGAHDRLTVLLRVIATDRLLRKQARLRGQEH